MKERPFSPKGAWLDLAVETLNFILLQYLLACGLISAQSHPLFIPLLATDSFLVSKYLTCLEGRCSRPIKYWILGSSLLVVIGMVAFLGYLPISMTPVLLR